MKSKVDRNAKIIGVTLGWTGDPQLAFSDGTIYFKPELDRILHPEYFPNNECWPVDPKTGEKLFIRPRKY